MSKYKISKVNDVYELIELSTGELIKKNRSYAKVNKMKTFLENGGGFDGFTPNFIVKKTNIINSAT